MHQSSFLAFLLYTVISTSQCNAGWIDPDTPEEFLSTSAHFEKDTREYELVSCVVSVSYRFMHRFMLLCIMCINESNVICKFHFLSLLQK